LGKNCYTNVGVLFAKSISSLLYEPIELHKYLNYHISFIGWIKFYKVMAVSAGLYGGENWVLTENDKNRIQEAEIIFLRSTVRVRRQDRLTNKVIRKMLKVNSLNDIISKYKDNWFNHITRMNHSRFPRYMLS
jgi:hypothetical protein